MKQATLCLLIKENSAGGEILLAMKKRGFGVGKWNGVGGKIDFKKGDKNIVDTAIRETEEEIGIKIKEMEKVALLNFRFPYIVENERVKWNQDVHVFLVKNWEGEPIETEEMLPKWFKFAGIPFDKMWDDDKFWLLPVLEGKKLKADFIFKEGELIAKHDIKFIDNF